MRLVIRTNGSLTEAGACDSTTTLEYNRVRLNDSEFLVPRDVRLDILNTDGSEFRNRTGYANCHEFRGESELKFDSPADASASGNPAPAKASMPSPLALPAGLGFKLVFTEAIPSGTAAAGDRIRAKLASDIRDPASKAVLIPRGAEVSARIGALEYYPGPPSSVRMLVKLETVNLRGTAVPFSAKRGEEPAGNAPPAGRRGLRQRIPLGSFRSMDNASLGLFEFRNVKPDFLIKSGLESSWTTAEP